MKYEGVTFIEESVSKMTQEEFEAMHLNVLWQDKTEKIRKKMLAQVYSLIVKPDKQKSE